MSRANYDFIPVSWRTLVKAAGVIVLALPAILRAQDSVAEKQESRIEIKRRGSQPPTEAPAEHFTGRVRIEPLFQENDPSHTSAAYVTFEPGAHSAWHTHPLGQILIVTAGMCWVQRWGDAIEELPARRCGLDSAGSKTLAWSFTDERNDAHCDSGRGGR